MSISIFFFFTFVLIINFRDIKNQEIETYFLLVLLAIAIGYSYEQGLDIFYFLEIFALVFSFFYFADIIIAHIQYFILKIMKSEKEGYLFGEADMIFLAIISIFYISDNYFEISEFLFMVLASAFLFMLYNLYNHTFGAKVRAIAAIPFITSGFLFQKTFFQFI